MAREDLPGVKALYRRAFAAFMKVPDAELPSSDFISVRYEADPDTALVASMGGRLVGAQLLNRLGSLAVLGPGMVDPGAFAGLAGKLMAERAFQVGEARGVRDFAGYTFSDSTAHLDFHRRIGMFGGFLIATLGRPVGAIATLPDGCFTLGDGREEDALTLADARVLTGGLYPGLDLSAEAAVVTRAGVGAGLFLRGSGRLEAFALLHVGEGSEAEAGAAHVKFAYLRDDAGRGAAEKLLDGCEAVARSRGATRLTVGVNTEHRAAFRTLLDQRFTPLFYGVALHRGGRRPFPPPSFVLYDWR